MISIQKYVRAQSLEEAWQLNQSRRNRILGGMLWLRWRAPRLPGCPMFGVGRVRVVLVHRRGTALFVR